MVGPIIDQQLIVYPETDAIVGFRKESIGFTEPWLNLAEPAHAEAIRADGRVRRPAAPIKEDGRINPPHACAGEVDVVIIIAAQPCAVPNGRRIDGDSYWRRKTHCQAVVPSFCDQSM